MIPDRARAVLSAEQLEVVEQLEAEGGVRGMNFDVMTGALSVVAGDKRSVLVSPDGIIVEPPLWMTMQQAMSMAARIRAMERGPCTTGRG